MQNLKNFITTNTKKPRDFILAFLKWSCCSILVGILSGIIGGIFHEAVDLATHSRQNHPFLLYLLPFGGLVIVFLYHITSMKEDGGTNRVISSIRNSSTIPFRMAPLIFVSTVLTHLFGGSSGREGAALQIGGSISSSIGRILKLNEKDMHVIVMCGMSGVFSAVFGTPITATIFSMEVISVGVLYYVAFIPCLISAMVAFSIGKFFGTKPIHYTLSSIPTLDLGTIVRVIILALLCALISILFCITLHKSSSLYKRFIENEYLRIFVGGILVILLTLLIQTREYNGAGMEIVNHAINGSTNPEAFLLKIIFTAITLGAGFKGGEIVPSFFIGATFGNVVGGLLGLDPGFGAAIGLISVFCGVVNCPIASLLLSIELFGSSALILFCFACSISYVFSGYYGLYSSQKIMYSKLSPTYINKSTD
ncbi:MAG: chloride channel protein [Lachnospiraceae bacterium]|nr:chloride channel protein [Lachnospiraceae bacterium]